MKFFQRARTHRRRRTSEFFRQRTKDDVDEERDVFDAFAQRRHADADDIQTVIEIGAEAIGRDFCAEVAIGRGDEAKVRGQVADAADAAEAFVFDRFQQPRLHGHIHLADLIEEQRSVGGDLEQALLRIHRVRERAAFVAEELRLEQLLRQSGAIEVDKRRSRARRAVVDEAREDAFACRDLAEELVQILDGRGKTGQAFLIGRVATAQRDQLAARGHHARHLLQCQRQHAVVERFLQERFRSELHRLDHAVDGPNARHHDHRDSL